MSTCMNMMFVLCAVGSPAELAATLQNRLAALDQLSIEYSVTHYWYPQGASVLDRDAWRRDEDSLPVHHHEAQLVRPVLLDHLLEDYPGFSAGLACFSDTEALWNRHEPDPNGRAYFLLYEEPVGSALIFLKPIQQALDLNLAGAKDPSDPRVSILDLLLKPSTTILREVGGVTTFETAFARPGGSMQRFEYDFSENATPLRVRMEVDFQVFGGGTRRYVTEQHVLATQVINGFEFPTEVVLAKSYPESPRRRSLSLLEVSSVSHNPDLTLDDVTLVPHTYNSVILTHFADGGSLHEVYDETGALIRNDAFPPGGLACGDAKPRELARVTPDSTSRSSIVKPILGAVGVLVLGVAVLVAVRMRH